MLVATLGGPTMFARIGVMRALNRRCSLPVLPSVSYLTEGTGRERILIGTPQAGARWLTKNSARRRAIALETKRVGPICNIDGRNMIRFLCRGAYRRHNQIVCKIIVRW
jgi:hypothetical protein